MRFIILLFCFLMEEQNDKCDNSKISGKRL